MNPIHARFSSVEALRQSNVDIQAIKSEGQLEVNGKRYQIRAAADGSIAVLRPDQQSKADKFFKGAANLIGGQSQRAQIAQVLNEKAAAVPRLDRMLGRRFDLEKGGSSAVTGAIKAADSRASSKQTFAGFQQWAEKAEALGRDTEIGIYMIYKRDTPDTTPMNAVEQEDYLQTLQALDSKKNLIIRPQVHDDRQVEELDLRRYIAEEGNARTGFFRMVPKDRRPTEANSGRLTIGVEPRYGAQLARAMATMIDKDKAVTQGKVVGPAKYGQQTDSAILYINGDLAKAVKLGEKLKKLSGIPAEGFVEHTPLSMQSTGRGLSYAESVEGQSSSHGQARTHVIMDALNGQGPMEDRLKTALAARGYDPENPALRARN
ncbi:MULTISPECIES: T3SS effector HopA1 family protein [Pseudomonas syringae group]|uniref:Type III effector HopA1 n=1 Tax=Pseudomonas syringae pv. actinidiae TaxID=103796 RepID=A0A7Z6UC05_PSESF|nr:MULTISPECIES: T3SS effector HopA1 family protein [Pseudomonas syringae group]MDU8455794.1 T3SS effector HopA1 family protein [Pseudomonas syringae group sp. J254-4]RMP84588.1 Type III effector HopA1 [Pseudomonas syringae pv. actinidiae]